MTQSMTVGAQRLAGRVHGVERVRSNGPAMRSGDPERALRLEAARQAERELERVRVRVLASY